MIATITNGDNPVDEIDFFSSSLDSLVGDGPGVAEDVTTGLFPLAEFKKHCDLNPGLSWQSALQVFWRVHLFAAQERKFDPSQPKLSPFSGLQSEPICTVIWHRATAVKRIMVFKRYI